VPRRSAAKVPKVSLEAPPPLQSIRILGVRVDVVDMAASLEHIEALVQRRDGCHLVATVNPEFVMRARRDPAFSAVLESASLALADGDYVLWAARRQGQRLRERVAGSDLVPELASLSARRGYRLFLLGGAPGVAEEAARRLVRRNPELVVAGTHAGSPRPEDDAESLALIRSARPDILLVAYGAPYQEFWIARHREQLQVPVAMGVGGALDFLAGRVPRAPRWMRAAHVEWLFRLVRQPWRARRMAVLPQYVVEVIRSTK
jgi:N-acetylglucosaminyldiphosphoundecaprenol N-acetyl-beta-D-mannosaminyltransferase